MKVKWKRSEKMWTLRSQIVMWFLNQEVQFQASAAKVVEISKEIKAIKEESDTFH